MFDGEHVASRIRQPATGVASAWFAWFVAFPAFPAFLAFLSMCSGVGSASFRNDSLTAVRSSRPIRLRKPTRLVAANGHSAWKPGSPMKY